MPKLNRSNQPLTNLADRAREFGVQALHVALEAWPEGSAMAAAVASYI